MTYVEQYLNQEEKVVFQTRIHWIVFAPMCFVTVVILSMNIIFQSNPSYVLFIRCLGALCFLRALSLFIVYLSSEYGVTCKRVLGKTGLIEIQSLDILLQRVEAVRLSQGMLGRMLNFGDVIVTGTGGTQEILYDLPDPHLVRKIIQENVQKIYESSPLNQIKEAV